MVELKRIGALSIAKIIGLVELVYGLALAVLLLLAGSTLSAFLGSSLSLFTGMGLIVLVALPIMGCVGAFLGYGIAALVYDALAPRMGGLILEIKGRRLNKIGVLSLGKFSAVAGAVIGLVSGIFAAAVASATLPGPAAAVIVVMTMVVTTVVLTVLMMILAAVYNAASSLMGGVILEISSGKLKGVGVESYTKMLALFGLIEGLFVGAIYATLSANPAASAALPSAAVSLGVESIVAFPLVYLVIGIVCGASGAWLYNWFAKRIGGIELTLN
jgi:hypothetical protein